MKFGSREQFTCTLHRLTTYLNQKGERFSIYIVFTCNWLKKATWKTECYPVGQFADAPVEIIFSILQITNVYLFNDVNGVSNWSNTREYSFYSKIGFVKFKKKNISNSFWNLMRHLGHKHVLKSSANTILKMKTVSTYF